MFGETIIILLFLGAIVIGGLFLMKMYQHNPEFFFKMLNYLLLFGLAITLSIISVLLGFRTEDRGRSKYYSNLEEVKQIWGSTIKQTPPTISYETLTTVERAHLQTGKPYKVKKKIRKDIKIKTSNVFVKIDKDIRKKGLQLYNGYTLRFIGTYTLKNPLSHDKKIFFHLPLPTGGNNITNATIKANGNLYNKDQRVADGLDWSGIIAKGGSVTIEISYLCQGLDSFTYALDYYTREIPDFKYVVNTDFDKSTINYMKNSMVHSGVLEDDGRTEISWEAKNLITRQPIAISFDTGKRIDQIIANLYYYSPIAICLFLAILLVFSIAYDIRLHFMHFLFFGAGFVFFYFFLSYIVSYAGFMLGFILSALLSGGMVSYYAKILKRGSKLVLGTTIGLAMFQLFFTFAFYFPMHTGFMILLGAALTLVLIMRITSEIEWEGKF